MLLNRRDCLRWGAATTSAALLGACTSHPLGQTSSKSGTGFYQQRVGQAWVTALSDGVGRRPLEAGFVKNTPLPQVQAALAAAGLPITHLDVPYTCFVLDVQGKRYLLDAGFGDNGAAGTGHLHAHMRAAGIAPDSIDAIFISHMHGDHIQGLRRKDGSLVYPKAQIYIPQPEAAFWLDDARMKAMSEAARGGFTTVRRVFKGYPRELIQLFTPGEEIAPGLRTIAAFGHSPGHTALQLQSEGERFTFIGDTAHLPVLFVRNPDWQVQFDMQPEQARATRHALLAQLAQEGGWVGGYHFPLPAIGRIQKTSTGYDWVASK